MTMILEAIEVEGKSGGLSSSDVDLRSSLNARIAEAAVRLAR